MTVPSLWRNRDFLLLWSGQIVATVGARMSATAMPLLVLATTHSAADAGLVGAAGALPFLVVQIPAGILVDRWDRKRIMVLSQLVAGVALTALPLALWAGVITVPLVAAVAFVQGVSFTAYGLAERASLPRLVHTDLLPAALAQNEAKTRGAALAGPPLGGALFGVAAALPFLANAVGYVAATVAATAVRTDLRSTAGRRTESLWAEATSGLRWTWRSPLVRATSLLVAGSNFLFQAMVLTIVVRATETGASAGRVGVMLGIFGAGGLLGALVAAGSYRVFSPKTVVIGVNWVWALLFPLLATTHNPVLLGLICAGSAFMGPMWNVVIGAYQLMLVPDELRGRVGSASTMMAWGVIPLGSLAAGYLLELRGSTFTIVAMAVAMVAIALAATFSPAVRSAPASTMDLGHFATAGGSKVSKVQTRGSV